MSTINIIIANGGGGLKIADAFVQQCLASAQDIGKTHIFINDPDKTCGDLAALKSSCEDYKAIKKYSNNEFAKTEIVLETQNLAMQTNDEQNTNSTGQTIKKVGELIPENDKRRIGLNGCYTSAEKELDLAEGLYGKGHIGAIKNIEYRLTFEDGTNALARLCQQMLNNTNDVCVVSIGSTDGGTGRSFALENLKQLREKCTGVNGTQLYTALVLLGPCLLHEDPTDQERDEHPNLLSKTAFSRTYEAWYELSQEQQLFNNTLNQLYICGLKEMDNGGQCFCSKKQSRHKTHLLHYAAGLYIYNLFNEKKNKNVFGTGQLCTTVFDDAPSISNKLTWDNISGNDTEGCISFMRWCYLICNLIIPFFQQNLDTVNNSVFVNNAKKSIFSRKVPQLDQELLDQLNQKLKTIESGLKYYAVCFKDMQECTKFGSKADLELYSLTVLKELSADSLYNDDNSGTNSKKFEHILSKDLFNMSNLTDRNIYQQKNVKSADMYMDELSQNDSVKASIRRCSEYQDMDEGSKLETVEGLLNSILSVAYKLVKI